MFIYLYKYNSISHATYSFPLLKYHQNNLDSESNTLQIKQIM